jgi:biotin transport system substrate-specific component
MTTQTPSLTLAEAIFPQTGLALRVKQLVLVAAGIATLVLAAKIKIPMFPVPMTMGTFAVLSIGAAYGTRLGLATILGYMLVGALGFDVFAGSSAEVSGLSYMMGSTGGYLVGYVLAVVALGALARKGWDRARGKMALALVLGNALIYVPGLIWLTVLYGLEAPILSWGLTPFLLGDVVKLALVALLLPALWSLVGRARK